MDTKELLNKIAKLKNAIDLESDADTKKLYQKKVDALEKQIAEAEVKVEKVEAKAAAEEKKDLSEAEEKIKKLKSALALESDPDTKALYQKKISKLEETLKDVKQEIKEEKKEIAEQKKDIKQATKEVKSAQKEVRKTAIKKVAAKQVERKQVVTRKAKRKTKIKTIISDLDKLINKNKELKAKYKDKGVDLKKDASRSAKPFGYRFVGKHDYRVPTEAQIRRGLKRGTIDYEARPNRSDKYPEATIKLADGGNVADDRRRIVLRISEMMRSYFEFKKNNDSDYGYNIESYDFSDLESGDFDIIEIRRGNDYLIIEKDKPDYIIFNGKKYYNKDLFKQGDKYFFVYYDETYTFKPNGDVGALWGTEGKLHDIGTSGLNADLFIYMFDNKTDWENIPEDYEFADGGMMMADGGMAKYGTMMIDGKEETIFEPIKGYKIYESKERGGEPFVIEILKYPNYAGKGVRYYYNDSRRSEREYSNNLNSVMELMEKDLVRHKGKKITEIKYFADGGMMAKGGELSTSTLKDIQRKFDRNEDKNYHSENVVLLATFFGTKEDIMEAKRILALHKKEGSLSSENGKKRRDLSIKLFKAWDKEREKSGLMAEGGMMRRGGRTKAAITADKRYKALKAGRRVSEDGNVYYESRANRSDVSRRDKLADGGMMARGGAVKKKVASKSNPKPSNKVGKSIQDKHRFAKPAGWRWKEEAFEKRIIERKQLAMSPSKKMRDKYPNLVYFEDRLNKADAKPTRTSADSI